MTNQAVRVLFGSGPPELIEATLARWTGDLPLIVVSEFPPPSGEWIPFHIHRRPEANRESILAKLNGREMREGAILLDQIIPHEELRALGHLMLGDRAAWFDVTGPTTLARYGLREKKRKLRKHVNTALRLLSPREAWLSILYRQALHHAHRIVQSRSKAKLLPEIQNPEGTSVVIPSRNGRDLLARCLPGLRSATEIIVVDNGSNDGTAEWLAREYPNVIIEHNSKPLAFAVAMNRGIARARYAYICALNNDMVVEPGFLEALRAPFDEVPDLFSSSAQIFLPEGQRREETGKTVLNPDPHPTDFPMRCDIPLDGEDLSYVPYGSGGCSMYSAAKLTALGGFDTSYTPAYVEDLDLGMRGWACGWPSVYCAKARVLHRHRTTTTKYFSPAELDDALEKNYLKFLVRLYAHPDLFRLVWKRAVLRLKVLGKARLLMLASHIEAVPVWTVDRELLPLFNGSVAVFPGRARSGRPVVLVASPYIPFPLAHGAAVRIYNLVREASKDFDVVLIAFVEQPHAVPQELLDLCAEVVTVWRPGRHTFPDRGRPDTVEEFDTPTFHAALRQTIAKWQPRIVQLEFTQMAVYAEDCGSIPTILVEHDITYDLYAQLLARPETNDWETQRQHERWVAFETKAWQRVTRVVTMSEKDRAVVGGPAAIAIGNGVDLDRFQPAAFDRQRASDEARTQLASDPEGFIAAYRHNFGNVFSADEASELFACYAQSFESRARFHSAIHESSRSLRDQTFAQALRESDSPRRVIFTQGGSGSGKSTIVPALLKDGPALVYDSTLSSLAGARASIEQALAANKEVIVAHIRRDIEESFLANLQRAIRSTGGGRTTNITAMIRSHKGADEVLAAIVEEYRGHPQVKILAFLHEDGRVVEVTIDALAPRDYTGVDERLREIIEHSRDRIPEAVYGAGLGVLGQRGDRGLAEVRGQGRPVHPGLPAVRPSDQLHLHAAQEAVTPDPRRLLFIGSFAHRPNVLALEFFLRDVMPHLKDVTLHVIAGKNHTRFWDLRYPNVEVEGFVSDVRPAYRRAAVVIAPLIASAGTNVKIVEAMAMGKAIVSTEAGIHGLELDLGEDVIVENDPKAMAAAITLLLTSAEYRRTLERHARATAERVYGWQAMGRVQKQLYDQLL